MFRNVIEIVISVDTAIIIAGYIFANDGEVLVVVNAIDTFVSIYKPVAHQAQMISAMIADRIFG